MCLHPPPLWPDNSQPFFPSLQLYSASVPGAFSIGSIIASLTGGDLEKIMDQIEANDPVKGMMTGIFCRGWLSTAVRLKIWRNVESRLWLRSMI